MTIAQYRKRVAQAPREDTVRVAVNTLSESSLEAPKKRLKIYEDLEGNVPFSIGMGLNQMILQGRKQGQNTRVVERTLPQHIMRLGQLSFEALGDSRFTTDFEDKKTFPEFQAKLQSLGTEAPEIIKATLEAQDSSGKTIAHRLIEKRQIKFIKELLLQLGGRFEIDIKDKQGRTPLATAIALNENEMAACLLVMGSDKEEARNPSSKGLAFNRGLYPILNIDSGKLLNREAFKRSLQRVIELPCSEDFFARLRDPKEKLTLEDIELLGQIPRLEKITLADGCDAVTSHEVFATLMRTALLTRRGSMTTTTEPLVLNKTESSKDEISRQSFDMMLKSEGLSELKPDNWKVAGRTIFIDRPGGKRLAVKLAKKTETAKPHPLARELQMTQELTKQVIDLGIGSELPTARRLVNLSEIPVEVTSAIKEQANQGHHHFGLAQSDNGVLAYLYDAPADYDRYLSDPTITAGELHRGMKNFVRDFGLCAAQGLFHTAPADFQHDAVSASGAGRPHLITFESWLAHFRFGAGRIVNWQSGVGTPNARVTGLADLKHLKSLGEASSRYDASNLHAEQEMRYSDAEKSLLAEVELLAGGLFAATMIAASSWKSRLECARRGETEVEAIPLETELRAIFESFVQGYLGSDEKSAQEVVGKLSLDFDRMGAQIRFFCSNNYVEHANERKGGDGPGGSLSRRSFAAMPHLSQGINFSEKFHAIDPLVLQNLYGRGGSGEPRESPEVSSAYMKSSVTWDSENGWTNAQRQANLGPYQGPLAVQAMVSAVFSTVYTSLMLKNTNGT